VLVDWVDPWSHAGWVEDDDADAALDRDLGCTSVGWIVRENEERIVLASSRVAAENGLGDLFAIPRRVIDRIVPLREAA